ncbi:glycerol dehydrogenase [Clostridium vincentii]|uniref:Glycerol dehydrogenase n=1 Tax=Clostridium vincentii TaxID=52704 RepID=A0A2T0B6H7_9CLOT|nr:glycerol dehydrogenase [Clostridium vincentii]PRR79486.1 Glycerol dehydrogenase [Clostridium vincentii]
MAKIMISPGKYIQGNGELANIAQYVSVLGGKALCLISESGLKRVKATVDKSFEIENITVKYDLSSGECCMTEVNRIIKVCEDNNVNVLIGIGGGKIIDTIKAVGYYKDIPVVIVPTIAATDAPCSALSVLYTDTGVFDKYLFLKQNPNIVLVDTGIIAKAPVRLLVSGMGDALATYFEARACEKSNAITCAAGTTTLAASALAKLCYDTLIAEGYKSKLAVEEGVCTKSVEKIVEANTLLSGIGFESGGIAAAHAIHNGFTVLPACHHMYHGEKVAFGTLAQLVLEDAPMEEIEEVLYFCNNVGLPTTLKQLGINEIKPEEIMEVAKVATSKEDTAHNMPFDVTPEDVYAAILTANKLGEDYI